MKASLLVIALVALASPALARDWIVTPNGATSAAGTDAKPTNPTSAIARSRPGDIVYLRGDVGVYTQGIVIPANKGGVEGKRLIVRRHWKEQPVITPTGTEDCVTVLADWVHVNGLICKDAPNNGIVVAGLHSWIKLNTIDGAMESGIAVVPKDNGGRGSFANILENTVTHASRRNEPRGAPDDVAGGWAQAIVTTAPGTNIWDNVLTDNWGEAIVVRADDAVVENNKIGRAFSSAILLEGADKSVVKGNKITLDGDPSFLLTTLAEAAPQPVTEAAGEAAPGDETTDEPEGPEEPEPPVTEEPPVVEPDPTPEPPAPPATESRRANGVALAGPAVENVELSGNTIEGANDGILAAAGVGKVTALGLTGNTVTKPVGYGVDLSALPAGSSGKMTGNTVTKPGLAKYRTPRGIVRNNNK